MRYQTLKDLEGIELESGRPFRFACCDCGLVHDVVIVSADEKPVGFAVKRNHRSTAGRRRHAWPGANTGIPVSLKKTGGDPWQPIETAPKDGTPLLLFARATTATASIDMFGWYMAGRGWIAQSLCGQEIVDIVPSHWMERPPFPKEKS